MPNWLKNLIKGGSAEIPDGEGRAWFEELARYLPTHVSAELANDILAYVATGQPNKVLAEIANTKAGLGFSHEWLAEVRPYHNVATAPPAAAIRWGRVLRASLTHAYWTPVFELDAALDWVEPLLIHTHRASNYGSAELPVAEAVTGARFDAWIAEGGGAADALVRAGILAVDRYGGSRARSLLRFADFGEWLHGHIETVRAMVLPSAVDARLHVIGLLERAHDGTLTALAGPLASLATATSKQVRVAVEPLIARAGRAILEPLQDIAQNGKPPERALALQQLHRLAAELEDASLETLARDIASNDGAASVRELVAEWDRQRTIGQDEAPFEYDLPAINLQVSTTPALEVALDRLRTNVAASAEKANAHAEGFNARNARQGSRWRRDLLPIVDKVWVKDLLRRLGQPGPAPFEGRQILSGHIGPNIDTEFVERSGLDAIGLIKLLDCLGLLIENARLGLFVDGVLELSHAITGRPTLLELSQSLRTLGHDASVVLTSYCSWHPIASKWPPEDVWPFFAHELETVEAALDSATSYSFERANLYRGLATLPRLPARIADKLFAIALGTAKSERRLAQDALQTVTDKHERIAAALGDGKAEVRAVAAEWLTRLANPETLPAVEAALKKEKNDVVKGALLDAVEALGGDVDRWFDRDALAKEAKKGLAKGLPKKTLEWFPQAALPEVRWADTGKPVGPEVLTWICVQAVKAKSPEPNVMLRKWSGLFERESREQLARFLLESWLYEDARPITPEEAQNLAVQQAQSTHSYMQRNPKYYEDSPLFGLSVEQLTARFLPGYLRQPRGSAIASKGLLAVVAACGGSGIAEPTGRYLKEWFGSRAAQGKALIAMLGWVDHPAATQLMLSIGSRFRTKSFQTEAIAQAQALAERKGWTLDELSDRTIPTGGFDDDGALTLDFGERAFEARLQPDMSIQLLNPDGKTIKALPKPRADDDEEKAKDSKRALSAAKKELKAIVKLQTERLYEALCTERSWSAADWTAYLLGHPVMRHLVQRLVWLARTGDDEPPVGFRPLDDGTLTDVGDEPFTLDENATVHLAHDTLLDKDAIAAWQQHLVDYEIAPLFQQLGKGVYALPDDAKQQQKIEDFEGHVLESFALRGRATKLGYTRGQAEDAGFFSTYEKRFPTLELTALVEFTGNCLPEENRKVALKSLQFCRESVDRHQPLNLGDVPAVLLSECYQDIRLIAAEGQGYVDDWEKQTEW